MNNSILESIKNSIERLTWSSNSKKEKALKLCIYIFNQYVYDGGDFYQYKSLSDKFFCSVIKTKSYVKEIKDTLFQGQILQVNNSYDVKQGLGKGYRFTNNIINYSDEYHICYPTAATPINTDYPYVTLNDKILQILEGLTINEKVYSYIDSFTISTNDLFIDENIKDEYVNLKFENGDYRYSFENALKQAKESNMNLIQYKGKCYIDSPESFITRKETELKLIFRKSIFDIKNKLFRVSRNQTNNRLDYNLTNMKSMLLNYLSFDNEQLVEIDISNAQFAILSHLTKELDENFIQLSQNGTLYRFISEKLNITEKEAKQLMFKVAFDKVKVEQDSIRNIFPKTMKFIDDYKSKQGYKLFSNLLQVNESNIMIDGLLNHLLEKGFSVFPIHDAVRVKSSQVSIIKQEIESYFKSINFKCNLRAKNSPENKRIVKFNYKGFKEMEIEITKDDIETFKSGLNQLKTSSIEVCETTVLDIKMDKYKREYLFQKWNSRISSNGIKNN